MTTEAEQELITGKLLRPDVVRTPTGRLSYCHIFTPFQQEGVEGPSRPRYSTSLAFPMGADLTILQAQIEERAKIKFGPDYKKKFPRLKLPFYQTADYPKMGLDPDEFPKFIRTSANVSNAFPPPTVVDIHGATLGADREAEAYSGRWAVLVVNTFAYDQAANKGVSFGLQGVQLREDDERLGGGATLAPDDFVAVPVSESADNLFRTNYVA